MTKQQLLQEDKEIEQDIAELKENLDHIDAELSELKERKRLRQSIITKRKEKFLLEEARSKMKDKLIKGKSLSWDELKLLFEEDKSESFK